MGCRRELPRSSGIISMTSMATHNSRIILYYSFTCNKLFHKNITPSLGTKISKDHKNLFVFQKLVLTISVTSDSPLLEKISAHNIQFHLLTTNWWIVSIYIIFVWGVSVLLCPNISWTFNFHIFYLNIMVYLLLFFLHFLFPLQQVFRYDEIIGTTTTLSLHAFSHFKFLIYFVAKRMQQKTSIYILSIDKTDK